MTHSEFWLLTEALLAANKRERAVDWVYRRLGDLMDDEFFGEASSFVETAIGKDMALMLSMLTASCNHRRKMNGAWNRLRSHIAGRGASEGRELLLGFPESEDAGYPPLVPPIPY